jgi:hypothetical protein
MSSEDKVKEIQEQITKIKAEKVDLEKEIHVKNKAHSYFCDKLSELEKEILKIQASDLNNFSEDNKPIDAYWLGLIGWNADDSYRYRHYWSDRFTLDHSCTTNKLSKLFGSDIWVLMTQDSEDVVIAVNTRAELVSLMFSLKMV